MSLTWNMTTTNSHCLSLHSAVWSLFSPKGVIWRRAQIHQEITDTVMEHFRSPYKEWEEMPSASFFRDWENSNWADYCVFKEKGRAPGISLQGSHYPGEHCCEGGILSESPRERLAQRAHLNCPLRARLNQRILQEEIWLESAPDPRKWKTTPKPHTLEAWDIKTFNGVFQRVSSSTMNIWRSLLGEFQSLWHSDYLQRLKHAKGWML